MFCKSLFFCKRSTALPTSSASYSRHHYIRLLQAIYPSTPGEEGPRQSHLSLLVSYAQNHPKKLMKIGKYLDSRLKKDIKKNRTGYIKVSFDILNSLLDSCSKHLNLFAIYVLAMVCQVLDMANTELNIMAATTFVMFGSHYVHNGLENLPEFADNYSIVITKFCALASYESKDPLIQSRLRLCGLKALHSMLASPSFLSTSHAEHLLMQTIPYLILNIIEKPTEAPSLTRLKETGSATGHIRISIQDELITDSELDNIAEDCLREVAKNLTAPTLRWVIEPILLSLENSGKIRKPTFALSIFSIIRHFMLPQHQSFLLSSLLSRLVATKHDETKKALLLTITHLITNSDPIVCTIELLDTLSKHMDARAEVEECFISLAQHHRSNAVPNQNGKTPSIAEFIIERIKAERDEKKRHVLVGVADRVAEIEQIPLEESTAVALVDTMMEFDDVLTLAGLYRCFHFMVRRIPSTAKLEWIQKFKKVIVRSFPPKPIVSATQVELVGYGSLILSLQLAISAAFKMFPIVLIKQLLPIVHYISQCMSNVAMERFAAEVLLVASQSNGKQNEISDIIDPVVKKCTWGNWTLDQSREGFAMVTTSPPVTLPWTKIYTVFGLEPDTDFATGTGLDGDGLTLPRGLAEKGVHQKKSTGNLSISGLSSRKIGSAKSAVGGAFSETSTSVTASNLKEALMGGFSSPVATSETVSSVGATVSSTVAIEMQDIRISR